MEEGHRSHSSATEWCRQRTYNAHCDLQSIAAQRNAQRLCVCNYQTAANEKHCFCFLWCFWRLCVAIRGLILAYRSLFTKVFVHGTCFFSFFLCELGALGREVRTHSVRNTSQAKRQIQALGLTWNKAHNTRRLFQTTGR